MPANINFTLFTDEVVLWENKDAVNQFFSNITVPDAAPGVSGSVKQAANIAALIDNTFLTINVTDETGTVTPYIVVSQSQFNELKAAMTALLLNMKAAGIMVGD